MQVKHIGFIALENYIWSQEFGLVAWDQGSYKQFRLVMTSTGLVMTKVCLVMFLQDRAGLAKPSFRLEKPSVELEVIGSMLIHIGPG